jgi:glycosyltransferase involved in cell wall biosynthesis
VAEFREEQNSYDFKLVVAMCVYNEEQFLEEALNDCLKINDLDGIHILDGAWKLGGNSMISTDKTADIIQGWKEKHPEIKITYDHRTNTIWNSEGEKRNFQLMSIEDIYGKSYIIVKDGDELFNFNCGKNSIWLKRELTTKYPAVGIAKSYAYNSDISAIGVRFIPSGQNIHYHTDKAMLVHDGKCNILCDYNMDGSAFVKNNKCFDFDQMFWVNHWNIRDHERQLAKDIYSTKVFDGKPYADCTYNKGNI